MPRNLSPIGALRALDEKAFAERVTGALFDAKDNRVLAAQKLGVSHRQFCRYLTLLKLPKHVNQYRRGAREVPEEKPEA